MMIAIVVPDTQDGKKKMCFLKHKNLLNPFREKGH